MIKILTIGDIHVKLSALQEVRILKSKVIDIIKELSPDYVLITGDMQDSFSNIHTQVWNEILSFINDVRQTTEIIYIVGNHDLCRAAYYHTDEHCFNSFKGLDNVTIVDRSRELTLTNKTTSIKAFACAYMPPGEFIKHYDSYNPQDIRLVFTHQEFFNSDLGGIKSTAGDIWPDNYPLVINGHIHERSYQKHNILNVGSPRYTTFAEVTPRYLSYIEVDKDYLKEVPILLNMPRKHTFIFKVNEIDNRIAEFSNINEEDEIRLIVQDTENNVSSFKKTELYKTLNNTNGLKLVLKPIVARLISNDKKKMTFQESLVQYIRDTSPKTVGVLEEVFSAFKDKRV